MDVEIRGDVSPLAQGKFAQLLDLADEKVSSICLLLNNQKISEGDIRNFSFDNELKQRKKKLGLS